MSRITVKSKQAINMSCVEYLQLHRRMYAIVSNDCCRICLYTSDDVESNIYVDVTNEAFDSFLSYEMDFSMMLNIFASLCIKLGSLPLPF